MHRTVKILTALITALTLSSCGGGGSSSNDFIGGGNTAPTITGTPPASVAADETYLFQPTANDADSDTLTYAVTGLPGWATFDTNTGTIEGMPAAADIGTYTDIEISVSDGDVSASLPLFSIIVTAVAAQNFALRFYGNGVAAPDLDRVKLQLTIPRTTMLDHQQISVLRISQSSSG